jgi:hypothetical protein
MSVDEEAFVELAARLALHEQVLETLCAEQFDNRVPSKAAIDAFRQALIKRIRDDSQANPPEDTPADPTLTAKIADASTSQAEAFTERISVRVGSGTEVFRFR